ncbi:MAG TPA: zf-HC2 domain-containing protein [Pyrinomonadaceae bacterium]|nr:zf-HC2 domain-containing protein [Pyrinomonadaceae bacterium]
MPRPKSNKESERFRRMVHEHLQRRNHSSSQALPAGAHLDEDMLSAFVEGRLSETESAPLVKHLVSCSRCRHITAQLIRLDTELAGDVSEAPVPQQEEPGRIRRLLSDLASRVLPSTETEVFAYHAPADDFEQKDEAKEDDEPEEKPREG